MLNPVLKSHLLKRARNIVSTALCRGGPAVAAPTDEPSAVAAVVWVAMPDMVSRWRPLFRRLALKISVSSVFCHGSPQVTFTDRAGSPQRCELADLLIVTDVVLPGGTIDRRASLIQAKLFSSNGAIIITPQTIDQLELLETWPIFSFVSRSYRRGGRNFRAPRQPGNFSDSGRYGGVTLAGLSSHWEQIVPASSAPMTRGTGISLSEFVVGMLIGETAAGRRALAGGSDDWSATIDDLLTVAAGAPARLRSGFAGSKLRGTVSTALRSLGAAAASEQPMSKSGDDDEDPPEGGSGDDRREGPEGGISFVRIIVEDEREYL